MTYVDAYLLPLPKDNVEAYRQMAQKAGEIWMEYGALSYKECLIDDPKAEGMVSFQDAARCKPDEAAVVAFVQYNSREHRDAVNAKVMADPRLKEACEGGNMPFDFTRMAYGGFAALVDL